MTKEKTNKNIDEIVNEFDKKQRLFLAGKYHSTQFNEWFKQKLQEVEERKVEEIKGEINESMLAELVRFYDSNRGSGHTYATVNGVKNTPNAFLLVANEQQKKNTRLPREKQISIGGNEYILKGRRHAIVPDNFAISEMFYQILNLKSLTK